MRLDPSPIPKGKHTANSNRAYLSPDTIVSISGHILFIRSEAEGSAVLNQPQKTGIPRHSIRNFVD